MTYDRNLLKQAIRRIAGTGEVAAMKTMDVTVDSVDVTNRVCIVSSVDGSRNVDGLPVRLMASVADGELTVPEVEETVTIAWNEYTSPYIVSYSWITQKRFIIGEAELFIDKDKIEIIRKDTTIVLTDVIHIDTGTDKKTTIDLTDKINIKQDQAEIILDTNKFTIKNGSKNLFTILNNMFTHIQASTYANGAGTTGPPINISDFIQDQTDLGQLMQ